MFTFFLFSFSYLSFSQEVRYRLVNDTGSFFAHKNRKVKNTLRFRIHMAICSVLEWLF